MHVAFSVDCDECPAKKGWTCKGQDGSWFFHDSRTAKATLRNGVLSSTSEGGRDQ